MSGRFHRIDMLLAAAILLLFMIHPGAEDISGPEGLAEYSGIGEPSLLFDGEPETSVTIPAGSFLTLENEEGISSLYLIFDREYGSLTLTDDAGREAVVDTDGILHFYIELEEIFGDCPQRVTVAFSDGDAEVTELCLFSAGEVPDWVQQWQRIPDGGADMVLFSTHGDDEQLFFAGLLPFYGAEQGRRIQVVYFTDHRNMTLHRVHEMLNGLWAVGIRDYPIFGSFPDYYTFDMADAYRFYAEQGCSEDELLSFVVEQLRRFRPLVAVGHDVEGEYGHGMHKLYTDLLCKAAEQSHDPACFPELTRQWGVWDVPKTYLHLYPEGEIVLDWDVPLDSFGGKTAYAVTRDLGFAAHVSQQKDFAWYFRDSETAAQIPKYSPCRYGLYRTTVGEDTEKNDFFENLGPKQNESSIPEPTAEEPLPSVEPADPVQTLPEILVKDTSADKLWPLFPLVGTLVLAVLTVCGNLPPAKENLKNE